MIVTPQGKVAGGELPDGYYWVHYVLLQKPPGMQGPAFVIQPFIPAQQGGPPRPVPLPYQCACGTRKEADAGLHAVGAGRLPRAPDDPPIVVGTFRAPGKNLEGSPAERKALADALWRHLERWAARMDAMLAPPAGSA